MGSGFKDFTAGSVLTASDVDNYLMEQSVMYFATTAARDAAITAPEDGMVAYIGSNDANEGLYTYNGTSWRKGPGWNAPWGLITSSTSSTTQVTTFAGVETVIKASSSFTAVANRNYLITVTGTFFGDTSGATYTHRLRVDSVTGTVIANTRSYVGSTNEQHTISLAVNTTLSAGSRTINYTVERIAGSGDGGNLSGFPFYFTVTDVGAATGTPS